MKRLSTCAWIETSSAATASSHTRNSGRTASARAMPMRARCPPENWCGKRRAAAGSRPTRRSISATYSRCAFARDQAVHDGCFADDILHPHARVERRIRILKDHLDRKLRPPLGLPLKARSGLARATGAVLRSVRAVRQRSGQESICRSLTRRPSRPPRACGSRDPHHRPHARLPRARSRRAHSRSSQRRPAFSRSASRHRPAREAAAQGRSAKGSLGIAREPLLTSEDKRRQRLTQL